MIKASAMPLAARPESQDLLAQLTTLYQAGQAVTRAADEQAVVEALVKQLSYGRFDRGLVVLFREREEPRGEVCGFWDRAAESEAPAEWLESTRFAAESEALNDVAENPAVDAETRVYFARLGIEAMATVPLRTGAGLLGSLVLETRQETALRPEELQPYEALAGQAATVLENQRLLAAQQLRAQEADILNQIAATASSSLATDELLEQCLEVLQQALGYDAALVALFDRRGEHLALDATYQVPEALQRRLRMDGMDQTLCALTARRGAPYNERDIETVTEVPTAGLVKLGFRGYLGAPLVAEGRVLGTLCAFSKQVGHFGGDHERVMQAAGQQIGLAVRNSLQYAESQRRSEQYATLLRVYQQVQASSNLKEQIQLICQGVVDAGLYHRALLSVLDDAWQTIQELSGYAGLTDEERAFMASSTPPTREERMMRFAERFRVGNSYFVPAGEDPVRWRARLPSQRSEEQFDDWDPLDALMVPLWVGDRLVGVLNVDDPVDGKRPTAEALVPVELFAGLAARAIETGRLLANTEQLYRTVGELAQAQSADELAQATAEKLRGLVDAEWAVVILVDAQQRRVQRIVQAGNPLDELGQMDFETLWHGLGGLAMRTNTPILSLDAEDPREPADNQARRRERQIGSLMALPIAAGERVLGEVMLMNRADQRRFTEQDLGLLAALTGQAATVLENLRLLEAARQRAVQLQTAAEVSRAATSELQLETLFTGTIELIRERFGLYYVGLFLVDDAGAWAVLKAGTGEAGSKQIAAGHRLRVGGGSMIGQTITSREPSIALDVGEAAVHFANPHLPATRSEMALPLVSRDRVIGALTIQSAQAGAFEQADVAILRTIADQLANAIQNARLYEQVQESLAASERAQRRYVRQEWDREALARAGDERSGYQYDLMEVEPIGPALAVLQEEAGAPVLSRPLALSGVAIGRLGVEADEPDHEWDEDELAIIQAVAEQVSLALESAHHSEQAERRAAQLSAAAQVGQSISTVLTADELMETAAQAISKHFDLYHTAMFMVAPDGEHLVLREAAGHTGGVMKEINYQVRADASTLVGKAFLSRKPQMVPDLNKKGDGAPLWLQHPMLPDTRAEMAMPMIAGGQVYGVLDMHSNKLAAFDDVDAAVLRTVADQVTSALDNARLFEETRQSAAEQQMLFEVTTAAVTTDDLDEMLQRVADTLFKNMSGTDLAILMIDPGGRTLRQRAAVGYSALQDGSAEVPLGQGIAGWVAQTGEPMLIGDVRAAEHYVAHDPDTRSELAVPILVDQRVAGVINIESRRLYAFDADDLRLMQTLSSTLGAIIKSFNLVSELQEANELLAEMDRLKSQFLANMSHELRTPLNSIIGFSRVILKGIDGPITEMQEQDLNSIYTSGQHLLGLINNVLDLSKIEAGKMEVAPEPTQVADIIQGAMSAAVGLTKDKPVKLLTELPENLPLVWADPFRLRQVLLNLISNACKFTEEGSITAQAAFDEQVVFVQVIDTGMGIGEEDMDKLFKAFSQVDASSTRKVGGTGLGLAISAQLMEMQGGRIWVESTPGEGSAFSIAIPRVNPAGDAPVALMAPAPVKKAEPPAEELGEAPVEHLVLAIDDEQGVIDLYRRYLSEHHYRVEGATSAQMGLQRAIELADRLCAITVDLLMPDMNGWDLIRLLRKNPSTAEVPIVVCSIKLDQSPATELGVQEYLVKPILQEELLEALRRHHPSHTH